MELHEIKNKLQSSLTNLYQLDKTLFERNKGRGVCERSLVFRFVYYLQNSLPDYYVDCDFNSSAIIEIDDTGYARVTEQNGKQILNTDGKKVGRFIDIIVHKRELDQPNDLFCIEVKKWNNKTKEGTEKDRNNLKKLTSDYGYMYGFHLILGRNLESTSISIFQNGDRISNLISINRFINE
ncbi:MAG: hypothetical protein ACLFQM_07125 [Fidelibacterota bacterium]